MVQSQPIGVPITDLVRDHDLGMEDRLLMTLAASEALQRAHQRGRVHGHLCPSLVGLSLDGRELIADVAGFGEAPTPEAIEYMPPERSGEESDAPDTPDTRVDVYALGAMMYELAAGVLPHDIRGLSADAAGRIVSATAPRKLAPSEASPELAAIIERAIARNPDERYASVALLADDVRRHLRTEPVSAMPFTIRYALGTLARRHRSLVAVGVIAVLAFLGAVGFLSARFIIDRNTHRTVRAIAGRALVENEFLRGTLLSSSSTPQGTDPTLGYVLSDATMRLETELVGNPRVRAAVRLAIGEAQQSIGNWEEAKTSILSALEARRELFGGRSAPAAEAAFALARLEMDAANPQRDLDRAHELAEDALRISIQRSGPDAEPTLRCRQLVADVALAQGDVVVAERLYRDVLRRREASGEEHQPMKGDLWLGLARTVAEKGDLSAAESLATNALELYRAELGVRHPKTAQALTALSDFAEARGDLAEAEAMAVEAVEVPRTLHGNDALTTAAALVTLGQLQARRGRWDAAISSYRDALRIRTGVHGEFSVDVADVQWKLAEVFAAQGNFFEADSLATAATSTWRRIRGEGDATAAAGLGFLARVRSRRGLWADSEELHLRSLEYARATYGEQDPRSIAAHVSTSEFLMTQGRMGEATALLVRARRFANASGADATETRAALYRAEGRLALLRGDADSATAAFENALHLHDPIADRLAILRLRLDLGLAHHDRSRLQQAEIEFTAALDGFEEEPVVDGFDLAIGRARYADLLASRGRESEACGLFRQAEEGMRRTAAADESPLLAWVRVSRMLCEERWNRTTEEALLSEFGLTALTHRSLSMGQRERIVTRALSQCEDSGAAAHVTRLRTLLP